MDYEKHFSVKQVADILGKEENTIRQWILKDKIKSTKIGGSRRIYKSEVDKKLRGE